MYDLAALDLYIHLSSSLFICRSIVPSWKIRLDGLAQFLVENLAAENFYKNCGRPMVIMMAPVPHPRNNGPGPIQPNALTRTRLPAHACPRARAFID